MAAALLRVQNPSFGKELTYTVYVVLFAQMGRLKSAIGLLKILSMALILLDPLGKWIQRLVMGERLPGVLLQVLRMAEVHAYAVSTR